MVEDELIGQVIAGRYNVLEKMGEGGMGTVYLAEHVAIEKKLALKVLLPEFARKPDLKERFLREARAAAAIDHQNIVDITDFGETPTSSVFFAMEYLDGNDLAYHIKHSGPFPWTRVKRIALQVCRALGAAHAKRIVHRDMKPENIFLIEREGRPDFVKVLDFGIAKVSGSADGEHRLTRTGMIFGTPEYMSPEQAQGHSPDHRVDIYAVGVIMYEMLTGQVPFKADTFMGILTKHIFEEPSPPSEVAPQAGIPIDAEEIVLKAMCKDREERFQSMTEMASAISQATGRVTRGSGELIPARMLGGSGGSAGADGRVSAPAMSVAFPTSMSQTDLGVEPKLPSSRGRIAAFVGLGLLLVGGAVAAVIFGGGEGERRTDASGTTDPVSEMVSIDIVSTPPGARLFKGTELLGQTPAAIELPRSDRAVMLTIKAVGYREGRYPVVPNRNKEVLVTLTALQPVADVRSRDDAEATLGSSGDNSAAAGGATPGSPTDRGLRHPTRRASDHRRPSRDTSTERAPHPPPTDRSGQRPSDRSDRDRPRRVEDLINPFD